MITLPEWIFVYLFTLGVVFGLPVALEWIFAYLFTFGFIFGLPVTLVGLVLRLTEAIWGKPVGMLGSRRCLWIGVPLMLPWSLYIALALLT